MIIIWVMIPVILTHLFANQKTSMMEYYIVGTL